MARPHRRPMSKRSDCYELKGNNEAVKGNEEALKGIREALRGVSVRQDLLKDGGDIQGLWNSVRRWRRSVE